MLRQAGNSWSRGWNPNSCATSRYHLRCSAESLTVNEMPKSEQNLARLLKSLGLVVAACSMCFVLAECGSAIYWSRPRITSIHRVGQAIEVHTQASAREPKHRITSIYLVLPTSKLRLSAEFESVSTIDHELRSQGRIITVAHQPVNGSGGMFVLSLPEGELSAGEQAKLVIVSIIDGPFSRQLVRDRIVRLKGRM